MSQALEKPTEKVLMNFKTFYSALQNFSAQPAHTKKFLEDKRLTKFEKDILEGYLLIRNNLNGDVLSLFHEKHSALEPLTAQKNLLIGIALNNLGRFVEAEKCLHKAFEYFDSAREEYFKLISLLNLFAIADNLNDKKRMKQVLTELDDIEFNERKDEVRLLRCWFRYHSLCDNHAEVERTLLQIKKIKSHMSESDAIVHLLDLFNYRVKQEDFAESFEVLQKMKSHRKFQLTENYNYLKILLTHQRERKPIYCTDSDFKQYPFLLHQIKVIQMLDEGNLPEAKKYWSLLCQNYPHYYQENFEYLGDKNIFSICLSFHLSKEAQTEKVLPVGDITDQLYHLFKGRRSSVPKEELYELLWGEKAQSKDDLQRLSRSVYRLKIKYGIQLKTRKGSYYLPDEEAG